jgi:hypothetical protein
MAEEKSLIQKVLSVLKKAKEYLTKGLKVAGQCLGIIKKAEEELEKLDDKKD